MPVENPDIPDDGVRVSVLGYHDFSETEAETEMKIRTSKFRLQMETLRKLDLAVVSLPDFISWKNGEKEIPSKSVLLTFDDGWKSFHLEDPKYQPRHVFEMIRLMAMDERVIGR